MVEVPHEHAGFLRDPHAAVVQVDLSGRKPLVGDGHRRDGEHGHSDHADRRECPSAPSKPRKRRSEEHTSELQSLMRSSYAVFCLKKKKATTNKCKRVVPKHTA